MKDNLFSQKLDGIAPFEFNEAVVEVFPDMISRSVPGYTLMLEAIGKIAVRFAQSGTNIYDLGCSLGASTLSIRQKMPADKSVTYFAIDNSEAMISRAKNHILSFKGVGDVETLCADILHTDILQASVVVLNFTLQFIAIEQRNTLIQRIADGLVDGGVLILSEKIRFEDALIDNINLELHHDFKKTQGYSALEIAQKRDAIADVLIPETRQMHIERLESAGFTQVDTWFQYTNFVSFIAVK